MDQAVQLVQGIQLDREIQSILGVLLLSYKIMKYK